VRPFSWYAIPSLVVLVAAGGLVALASRPAAGGAPASAGGVRAFALPVPGGAEPGGVAAAAGAAVPVAAGAAPPARGRGDHSFYFTRGIYTSGWGRPSWATDYPKADQQFLTVLRRLTNLDAYASEHAVRLDDPELRRHPFLYILEVGTIALSPAEVTGLRDYLLAGGFVFVDDFWGDNGWYTFERQMKQVLPEHSIVDVGFDHPIFTNFYRLTELQQMPAINVWRRGGTTECFGCEVAARGIFDERGRLMMFIMWNTDNGDAWEWAEQPDIPLKFSTFAYQIGVNAVVYSMSH
jgi:hypothetical protein